jgi:uncharacterized membrane protein
MKEAGKRSIVKALTYRFWQSLNTFIISLIVTGKIDVATAIVSLEVLVKVFVYFWHERIWTKIKWGVEPTKEHLSNKNGKNFAKLD